MNKSQFFLEIRFPNKQMSQRMGIRHNSIFVLLKLFLMNIKLPVHHNSRLFSEMKVHNSQVKQNGLIFVKLISALILFKYLFSLKC